MRTHKYVHIHTHMYDLLKIHHSGKSRCYRELSFRERAESLRDMYLKLYGRKRETKIKGDKDDTTGEKDNVCAIIQYLTKFTSLSRYISLRVLSHDRFASIRI